jgi:biotin operon repressor
MSAIDKILLLLKDDNWHSLKEIKEKVSLSEANIKKVAIFLKEYEFVTLNEETKALKIQPTIRKFIEEIELLEKESF